MNKKNILIKEVKDYTFVLIFVILIRYGMSRVMRNPTFCICENNDADQLRGNREADQRLCFRCIDNCNLPTF